MYNLYVGFYRRKMRRELLYVNEYGGAIMPGLLVLASINLGLAFALFALCLVLGVVGGYLFQKIRIDKAGRTADKIIEDAKVAAEENKKQSIIDAKKEIYGLRQEADKEIKDRKNQVKDQERKLAQREERLDNRSTNLDKREESLIQKEHKIDDRKAEIEKQYHKVEELVQEQAVKLNEIADMSRDDARKIIMDRIEEEMSLEIAAYIRDEEEKAKDEAAHKAQSLLANAIQQYSSDVVNAKTISVVSLPNDEMKGRIIGREGRNIRAIEAATGVDIIIDDTPEAVVLSSFDPIRREIARRTLEALIADGRIQPTRIEDLVAKFQNELDNELKETGEKAVFDLGLSKIHPELVKIIGRLKYRTSYGQNALTHSMEVAYLAGKLAAEIDEDEILARRAGLLHDIGKAIDHEVEGSHVEIGVELANRYHEKAEVIDAIASHHGDVEAKSVIAHLVAAADTLSAARPGARSESLENYIKRLAQLEEICNNHKGVDKAYALQAGREVRILVKPEEINDTQAYKLARDIRLEIEGNVNYPGTIKVIVIRETRAQEVAK